MRGCKGRSALDRHQVQVQRVRTVQPSDPSRRTCLLLPARSFPYGKAENCGKTVSREFSVRAFDEENNISM
jgi:hypothetical protein